MFIAYLRVSTQRQGASGLGLEAQADSVRRYCCQVGQPILATFVDVESGARKHRAALQDALAACKKHKAVLLVAKLDRLSRSLAFVAQLLEADVEIRVADMPDANRLLLQMLAVFAEHERRLIGERTRAALAVAKARGTVLGRNGATLARVHRAAAREFATRIAPHILAAQRAGCGSARQIAQHLNMIGLRSREGSPWHPAGVARVLRRLRELDLASA